MNKMDTINWSTEINRYFNETSAINLSKSSISHPNSNASFEELEECFITGEDNIDFCINQEALQTSCPELFSFLQENYKGRSIELENTNNYLLDNLSKLINHNIFPTNSYDLIDLALFLDRFDSHDLSIQCLQHIEKAVDDESLLSILSNLKSFSSSPIGRYLHSFALTRMPEWFQSSFSIESLSPQILYAICSAHALCMNEGDVLRLLLAWDQAQNYDDTLLSTEIEGEKTLLDTVRIDWMEESEFKKLVIPLPHLSQNEKSILLEKIKERKSNSACSYKNYSPPRIRVKVLRESDNTFEARLRIPNARTAIIPPKSKELQALPSFRSPTIELAGKKWSLYTLYTENNYSCSSGITYLGNVNDASRSAIQVNATMKWLHPTKQRSPQVSGTRDLRPGDTLCWTISSSSRHSPHRFIDKSGHLNVHVKLSWKA